MIAFMKNASIDVNGVSMAAISKETAMAISFPVVSLCSALKGSVSYFWCLYAALSLSV